MILKVIGVIAGLLFAMNWICLLACQKFRGFPWGDYVLVFILALLIFKYADSLRNYAKLIPDTLQAMTEQPRESLQDIKNAFQETKSTSATVLNYFKGLVQRDLEERMEYKIE